MVTLFVHYPTCEVPVSEPYAAKYGSNFGFIFLHGQVTLVKLRPALEVELPKIEQIVTQI